MLITQDEARCITQYLDVNTAVPRQADVAFVFGTRHPEPAYLAADLVKRGIVRYVILTGGDNRRTGVDEAKAHLEILLRGGVARDCIVVEGESTNTLENVVYALPKMAGCIDPKSIQSIVVLTKWYHCRRAMMTLKRHWPEGIRYFAASYEPSGATRSDWWLNEEGCRRVLKEWCNIPEYLKRGDIAEIREDDGAFA
jgi:uncharacterized SAM-binding protein YcdF (DUF218 family)